MPWSSKSGASSPTCSSAAPREPPINITPRAQPAIRFNDNTPIPIVTTQSGSLDPASGHGNRRRSSCWFSSSGIVDVEAPAFEPRRPRAKSPAGRASRGGERRINNAFAVGTALTGGPPHRSQRALLTHWAPISGHDAQSLFGIRVQCSMLDDFHQPSVVDGIEESTDVRVEYPVHFLVNRAPLSRQATCRIRSSALYRSGDRT